MAVFRRVLLDRKSTRLNSSHTIISYAVFCLEKKRDRKSTRLNSSHTIISYAVLCLKKNRAHRRRPARRAWRRERLHLIGHPGGSVTFSDGVFFLMIRPPPVPPLFPYRPLFR